MAAWGNICRVCSSPADHEIFAKIPTFLHANCNEFLKWQKPINELIEETTGIKIAPDDGLPKNICELCVSYLKHAVNFREQCINNALSFNLVLKYKKLQRTESETKESDKDSYLISEQDLDYSSQRELEMVNFLSNNTFQEQNKVNKAMFDQTMPSNFCQQLDYLNTLFDKKCSSRRKSNYPKLSSKTNATRERNDFHTASSSDEAEDGTAVPMPTKVDIFSYKEKSFIEDDVLNILEVQQSVAINVPDNSQERKCKACLRRFMFNESFEQHKNECIELRLVKFIEEVNNLNSSVRMDISPHEFIRRMIFALRKICEWLMSYHSDITLPDLPQYTQVRQTSTESQTDQTDSDSKKDSSLKGISPILEPINTSTKRSVFNSSQNILCEIERCESQNSQKSALASNSSECPANVPQKLSYAECRTLKDRNRDRDRTLTNLLKDDISSKLPRINPFKLNCTARCQPCGLAFETLVAFEVHNALHHNYSK
ncbi:uncharacterized protein ACN427_000630 [Glossina fuscipes fuscipes]